MLRARRPSVRRTSSGEINGRHGRHEPTEHTFDGKGGLAIFYRVWRPAGTPRAVVAICHGVNSHSGQYLWAAEQLVADGLAVYALDLRGRGRSDGERFFVDSVADYVSDLGGADRDREGARARPAGVPARPQRRRRHLGASTRSTTRPSSPGSSARASPSACSAPDFALAVLKGLSHVAPRLPTCCKLKNEDFSRDPAVVRGTERRSADSRTRCSRSRPSPRWSAPTSGIEREFAPITLPVLILHGTADKATRPDGSQLFYDKAGSADKTLKLYEGHYHDLLNDLGREQVMADIIGWIGRHMPA